MNTLDEVYDHFLEEDVKVSLIDDTYYLLHGNYHLILVDEEFHGEMVPRIISTNVPFLKDKTEEAAELMITSITTNGIEEHKLH